MVINVKSANGKMSHGDKQLLQLLAGNNKTTTSPTRTNHVYLFLLLLLAIIIVIVVMMSIAWLLHRPSQGIMMTSVTWSDCTFPGTRGADVMNLTIGPSPIRIPGNVSIGVGMRIRRQLSPPAFTRIRIMKQIAFFWFDLPCIDEVGTCDYDDLCSLWPFFQSCPSAFTRNNIPCSCPFKVGDYKLPQQDMLQIFPDSSTPAWLESGYYWAEIRIFDSQRNNYLCNQLYLTILADY